MIAVAMYLTGLPLIYYLRDGLKLAPNNSAFTVAFAIGPLLLSLPFKNFRQFEAPNRVGYAMAAWFVIISFIYFILRDPYTAVKASYEYFSFAIIFFIFFGLLFITKESLNRNFIYLALFLSFIGAVMLLYYIARDPLYVIGQRAAIKFGEEEDAGGNPHIYGKGAYFGLILTVLALKYVKKVKIGMIPLFGMLVVFLVVLFLTQTMAALLATFLFLAAFTFFNFSFKKAYSTLLSLLLKWYIVVILAVGIGRGVMAYQENKDLLKPAISYLENRFAKIINSFFTSAEDAQKNKKHVDESASMRVHLVTVAIESLDENFEEGKLRYVIFGNGYKHLYIDVPHLEVFDSFGILIFIFYTVFYIYMIKISAAEMRKPESIATEFLAYGFIYFMIANFTGGVIIDYTRWGFYALIVRFITKK